MQEQSNNPTYSGDLSQISLPKLLYHMAAAKVVGRLVISRDIKKVEIRFDSGTPCLFIKDVDIDAWTKQLTQERIVDASKLQECIRLAQAKPEQLGNVLLEYSLLSTEQMMESLRKVFLESVEDIFRWRAGQYAFFQEKNPSESALKAMIEPWSMVVHGIRKGYTKDELNSLLHPYKKWFLGRKHNPHLQLDDLGLLPEEQEIFQLSSRNISLENLLSQYANNDQALSMVLSMLYLGLESDLLSLSPEANPNTNTPQPVQAANTDPKIQLSEEEQALLDIKTRLEKLDYFARLGIEKTSGSNEISRAFLEMAKKHHPDRLPIHSSAEMRSLTEQVFSLFNEAQQKLSDERFRSEYIAALEAGFQDENVDIRNIVEAENLFDEVEMLIKARKYPEALATIQKAIKLNPDEGEFQIYHGYIMFLTQPDANNAATRECMKIIEAGLKKRDMRVAKGYVFLGRIENASDNKANAEAMYQKALEIDPQDMEAARELRLLNMRKSEKSNKPKKWPWKK